METVTLTMEMIEAVMTKGRGLSMAKYRLLGGEGPMREGWKDGLVGNRVHASDYKLLRDTVGMSEREYRQLREERRQALDQRIAARRQAEGAAHLENERGRVAGVEANGPMRNDGLGRGSPTPKPTHIPGREVTGKYYTPTACAACATKLPWEPQCPACTRAFESRAAIARAEAGVVRRDPTPSVELDPVATSLRGTNSFEEFMARQLCFPFAEEVA